MFGENTTRRESGSHCSQERRSADIRLVASYRATWCHLYCSSKASGQHLCRVWRKGIAGLELTWHRWVYPRLGIGLKWFCRMQLSQLWALSSCWRLPLIQPRLKWVKLLSIWQIIFLLCRKVSVGQHSATTWHATWPQQLKTRSSTTWWSTRGRTRPCYTSDPAALFTGTEPSCQHTSLFLPLRPATSKDSSGRRTLTR